MLKLLPKIFLSSLVLMSAPSFALSVPFQDFTLNPYASLSASYSIGDHKLIFCYTNTTQNVRELRWTYNGQPNSSVIPQTLTNNAANGGRLADANGTLTIQNQTSGQLSYSCVFGF